MNGLSWHLLPLIFRLGLSYAGTPNTPDVTELLRQSYDEAPSIEVEAQIALSLGLIHAGTCDSDLTELFVNSIMERDMKKELGSPYARYLCLALGFLFLGKQEEAEVTLEALKIIPGVCLFPNLFVFFMSSCNLFPCLS